MESLGALLGRLDEKMINFMRSNGMRLLRISLGIVFFWFGLLKVMGRSPVANLVSGTVYWLPSETLLPLLGVWETAVGLGLLFRVALRLTLFLFWLQLAGTFLALILRPDIAFHENPVFLTVEGEFIIKNLVLIASGLVIGGTVKETKRK